MEICYGQVYLCSEKCSKQDCINDISLQGHIVYKLWTGIVSAPEMDEYDMRVCLTSNFKVCDVF